MEFMRSLRNDILLAEGSMSQEDAEQIILAAKDIIKQGKTDNKLKAIVVALKQSGFEGDVLHTAQQILDHSARTLLFHDFD
jgi:hypothetical protein